MNSDVVLFFRINSDEPDFSPESMLPSEMLGHMANLEAVFQSLANDFGMELSKSFIGLNRLERGSALLGCRLDEDALDIYNIIQRAPVDPDLRINISEESRSKIIKLHDNLAGHNRTARLESTFNQTSVDVLALAKAVNEDIERDFYIDVSNPMKTTVYGVLTSINLERSSAIIKTRGGKVSLNKIRGDLLSKIIDLLNGNRGAKLKVSGYAVYANDLIQIKSLNPSEVELVKPLTADAWASFKDDVNLSDEVAYSILKELSGK